MDLTSELERLSELHANGSLSDEEYAAAKQRLLEAGAGPPPQPNVGYAAAPPASQKSSAGAVVGVLVALGVVGLLVVLVLVLAVTFLGRSASSKFSSVGSRVGVVAPAPLWVVGR